MEEFELLALRSMKRASALAARIVGPADAEEVVQEALFRAWQQRATFAAGRRFTPWLLRIVTNSALDLLRQRRSAAAQETSAALDSLPPMQRTVATLYLVDGFCHAEIAAITSLKEATVRSHLSLARRRLRMCHPERSRGIPASR